MSRYWDVRVGRISRDCVHITPTPPGITFLCRVGKANMKPVLHNLHVPQKRNCEFGLWTQQLLKQQNKHLIKSSIHTKTTTLRDLPMHLILQTICPPSFHVSSSTGAQWCQHVGNVSGPENTSKHPNLSEICFLALFL